MIVLLKKHDEQTTLSVLYFSALGTKSSSRVLRKKTLETASKGNNTDAESELEDLSPDISEYEPSSEDVSDEEPQRRRHVNVKHVKPDEVHEEEEELVDKVAEDDITDLQPLQIRELEGMEETPRKTDKPRKRLRHPEIWTRNVSKTRRAHGEAYVSSRKKHIPGVYMKDQCGVNCRRKCYEKFTHAQRLDVFQRYYKFDTYIRKCDFIHSNTDKITKRSKTKENSRRNFSVLFYLPRDTERVQVCKTMFLNTLGIRKGVVDIAMKKRTKENTGEEDKRGRHVKKVTSTELLNSIRHHIESFAVVDSHYCRSGSKRKYLDPSLNITLMYNMYKSACIENDLEVAGASTYRKIFTEEYNLSFHHPKKDQCRICMAYNIPGANKDTMKDNYDTHIVAKERAREEKKRDKEEAQNSDGNSVCCNFDLQQVLLAPTDPSNNALFYKQRLKSFNFTVYDVNSKQGDCYMWTEVEGKRGSCEIASCLYQYFTSLPAVVTHICCFSDRCGGQNLNRFVCAMCLTAVQELPNLKTIDLKFMVVGHSEMECDSMHSAITTEQKRVGKVNWPADWKTIARSARRKGDKPYVVHDITHEQITDWKSHVDCNMTIRKEDMNGKPVHWQKMCWQRFTKERPCVMQFKEDFDEDFRALDCNKKTRGLNRTSLSNTKPLYASVLPISKERYSDLTSLFKSFPPALGPEYRPFYESLPHQEDAKNRSATDLVSSSESE